MTGIILMVVGVLHLGAGIVVYSASGKDKVKEETEARPTAANATPIADIPKVENSYNKGLEFEKFIVKKFNTKLFIVKEWAGDKYVNGVYAETTQYPDLLMEFIGYNQNKQFAVECKWRQNSFKDGVSFSTEEQLNRYRKFSKDRQLTVYLAIGLGGKADSPEKLYIVPLEKIAKPFILINQLEKYEKKLDANFYYDYKKGVLR